MKVLIVEDNSDIRSLLRQLLNDLVDEWRECSDGDEALEAYAAEHPDWVLMDLEMARVGGLEASRRIIAADPRARIVIVTFYDDPRLREAARNAGALGYVLKENLLELRRLLQPAAPVASPLELE